MKRLQLKRALKGDCLNILIIPGLEIGMDEKFPNVRRWYDLCKQRPGLRRGYEVGREFGKPGKMDAKAKEVLLGLKPEASGA